MQSDAIRREIRRNQGRTGQRLLELMRDAIRGAPGSASSSCSPIDGASAAEQLRMKASW